MKSIALKNGISDHHKKIMAIFALHLQKLSPKRFTLTAIKKLILNSFKWCLR